MAAGSARRNARLTTVLDTERAKRFQARPRRAQGLIAATPARRSGTPEEIADAVLYFINPPNFEAGQVLAVDGGLSQR